MDKNLLRRIASAVLLVPALVAAVLWIPSPYFAAGAAVFVAAGSWEWAGLSTRPSQGRRVAYVVATIVAMVLFYRFARAPAALLIFCAVGAAWWSVAMFRVVGVQSGRYPVSPGASWLHGLCGWLVLLPAFSALLLLHEFVPGGRWWILLLLTFVWSADIGAFCVGRRYGRRRLASRLSPGKSWEGVIGGAAVCLAIGIGVALGVGETFSSPWVFPMLGLGVALISVLGDLTESLVKRQAGVKDSGVFIPGHGGVLDRIDSLCAAAPCFALVLAGLFESRFLR